jgi:alpha-tubulin suppressor-like RCC1 family protein
MQLARQRNEELVPLKANRAKDALAYHEYAPPKKIACGLAHTLYLETTKEGGRGQDDEDDTTIFTRVMGWGSNKHNQLGVMPDQNVDAQAYKETHGDIGVAPWKLQMKAPTGEVFSENYPAEERDARSRPETHTDSTPRRLQHSDPNRDLREVFEVSCGGNHSMVLEKRHWNDGNVLTESRLWSFGLKAHGRLGRGKPAYLEDQEEGASDNSDIESDCDYPEEVFEKSSNGHMTFIAPGMNPDAKPVVQRICCGGDHTLAIVNFMGPSGQIAILQARVFAWGLGSYGALGNRSKKDSWYPQEVWFPEECMEDTRRCVTIMQIACGPKHSMALSHDGKLYTWGHGGNGRLGLGRHQTRLGESFKAQFDPQLVDRLKDTKIVYIAAGEAHSGCVDQLGGLHTWGAGSFGRCGHGMHMDCVWPSRVESLLGTSVSQIALGMFHSLAVNVKGQLYGWGKGPATGLDKGDNEFTPTPLPVTLEGCHNNPVYQVVAGPLHSVVLMSDGTLFVFGSSSECRMPSLGPGRQQERGDLGCPKRLDRLGWSKVMTDDMKKGIAKTTDVRMKDKHPRMPANISAGGCNSVTVLHSGEVWIWGAAVLAGSVEPAPESHDDEPNKDSEIAADDPNTWIPQQLRRGFRNSVVRSISIGKDHALALTEDQLLFAWGEGDCGQLGTGNLTTSGPQPYPTLIDNVSEVICCSAGELHSACIIAGGEAYTWGKASGGRLGLGATMNEGVQMLPEQVVIHVAGKKDLRMKQVECGSEHTCFISEDDRVLSCGVGWFGRLGQKNAGEQLCTSVSCSPA